jgi:1,2-dihydroxy-3-keto-5-methylthiopentene dioxygenase
MATLKIPAQNQTITELEAIQDYLQNIGLKFDHWEATHPLEPDAEAETVLAAYAPEIEALKKTGGYVTADVINITPDTPNLDMMLNKFNKEHWHDEDEVRFIIAGHGLFHINPIDSPVVAIEMEAGDLLSVPRGTLHWFDLCGDRRVRAIRLFQDPSGWTPNYTENDTATSFQPLCFGSAFVTPQT